MRPFCPRTAPGLVLKCHPEEVKGRARSPSPKYTAWLKKVSVSLGFDLGRWAVGTAPVACGGCL